MHAEHIEDLKKSTAMKQELSALQRKYEDLESIRSSADLKLEVA